MPKLIHLPYHWFSNIADLLEKRPFHAVTVALFCVFVGTGRILLEWIGGRPPAHVFIDVFAISLFYWTCFFTYGLIIGLLVPGRWTQRINVILVGIFCGLLPPLIDVLWYGIGNFRYTFYWDFPNHWQWQIFNPDKWIPLGEAAVLWFTIALVVLYVHLRTRNPVRAAVGGVLAYLGVMLLAGGHAWLAIHTAEFFDISSRYARLYFLLSLEILLCMAYYLGMHRALLRHLWFRALHALPFVAICFLGAAFAGGIAPVTFWIAGLFFVLILVALVQNDYYDASADAMQDRESVVTIHDVRFFTLSAWMLVIAAVIANSAVAFPMMLFVIVSMLYSFPLYHAKKYFPANMKIEGVWATSCFGAGMIGVWEFDISSGAMFNHVMPIWHAANATGDMDWQTLIGLLLVFGGWSAVSVVKDYKDMDADDAAGIQTIYVIARRRDWDIVRLHRRIAVVVALLMFLAALLLVLAGRLESWWIVVGLLAAVLFFPLVQRCRSYRAFRVFLWSTGLYLILLALGLHFQL